MWGVGCWIWGVGCGVLRGEKEENVQGHILGKPRVAAVSKRSGRAGTEEGSEGGRGQRV
jgi:hypothetical protein